MTYPCEIAHYHPPNWKWRPAWIDLHFKRAFAPVKLKYYGNSWTAERNSNQHWLFTSILTGICSCLCFKVARTAVQCLICRNCLRSWLYFSHSSRLGLVTSSIASIYAESGANGSCAANGSRLGLFAVASRSFWLAAATLGSLEWLNSNVRLLVYGYYRAITAAPWRGARFFASKDSNWHW